MTPESTASERVNNTTTAGDPVAAIEGMLARERAPIEPEKKAEPKSEPVETAPEAEPVEAQPNAQVEGGDAPKEENHEEGITADQLEAIELEVTTKGEDGRDVAEKLPVKELKLGYMRQKDYQRKTAEVARQREKVAEESRQAVEQSRAQYQQQLQQFQALVLETVAPELSNVDMNKLAQDDPFEYVKRRNRIDNITQTLSKIENAQKELTAKQKSEAESKRQETRARARETLDAEIPGFNDNLYQTIINSAEKYGYKKEEVAAWEDPRAIKLLYSAIKGQQSVPVAPSADKKVVIPPKVIRPGASADQTQARTQQAKAMTQLQKSGRIDDAASVIAARLR